MARVYNFSAGPAVLPEEVLSRAGSEILDYQGSGMSVMEMSHRSKVFQGIIDKAEADIRALMGIPDNYKVLFLQGGDSLLFATTFINLAPHRKADFVVTGSWAKKAYQEARILGDPNVVASSADKSFTYIPDCSDLPIREDADYLYICQNNTIYGTQYHTLPNTKGHMLVSDQSSMLLSEPVDVSRFGCIHAGVQKNVGPAGMQIVIVREDLIPDDLPGVPTMLRFKTQADKGSLYNTPNCWGIYMCGLAFQWLLGNGGLAAMHEKNAEKGKVLYDYLDASELFHPTVSDPESRSLMNVTFVTGDKDLDAEFVAQAAGAGLVNLKGHRTVGGMRASIYNAMPKAGVEALVNFMDGFERSHKRA